MADALPPQDAENWSDEEWIEWLESTDDSGEREPSVSAPRKGRSVGTQMLASVMLGLHEMIYGKQDEQQVQVAPAPGPPDDEDIEINLDPDDPSNSEIRFKNGE